MKSPLRLIPMMSTLFAATLSRGASALIRAPFVLALRRHTCAFRSLASRHKTLAMTLEVSDWCTSRWHQHCYRRRLEGHTELVGFSPYLMLALQGYREPAQGSSAVGSDKELVPLNVIAGRGRPPSRKRLIE